MITLAKNKIKSSTFLLSQLLSIPIESRAVSNVLLPWARWEGGFKTKFTNCTFMKQVSSDPAVRDAAVEVSKLLDQFIIEQGAREGVYLLAKSVAKEKDENPKVTRFREKLLLEFKHNDLELNKRENPSSSILNDMKMN